MPSPPATSVPARLAWAVAALVVATSASGGEIDDGFEGPETSWVLAESDAAPRVLRHERSADAPHGGGRCERITLECGAGSVVRMQVPIGPLAAIDELGAAVWVRASRADVRLGLRVRLPDWKSRKTGLPVETLVPGTVSRSGDRWERLEVGGLPAALARQLPPLRLEHGGDGGLAGAVATHVVLDLYSGPGRYEAAIDDLLLTGAVTGAATGGTAAVRSDPLVRPAAAAAPALAPDPPAGLARGVIEVDGLPFFPRSLEHNGEPLAAVAALGFNCVHLAVPAGADLLAEARQAGVWVICPPPDIPDVDLRDPESVPALRSWDRVLMWDLGTGLSEADLPALAERARRVRACDQRAGRPLVGAADSGLRAVSRHLDMLVARRTVLGTSLELVDYLTWLRERPRLARPGTPLLATLSTEIDPRACRQAAAIAGVGGRGLAVDPESLALASLSAVAAGARGILFASSSRIDSDDREARMRAAAARDTNLRLAVIEPWGAAGRFAAQAQSSSPEVQAVVLEAARARVVLAWRCVQGSQIVARRYGGGDVPEDETVSLLVPGVPEAHRAWEVAPGGLRPLTQRRVTGGVSVTLESFLTHSIVLLSGEPAVTGHVQERLRGQAEAELAAARTLASTTLAGAADMLPRLPPQAFSGPPPVAAAPMLAAANRLAAEGEQLAGGDPAAATALLRRAAAIAGQFERRIWENGVRADGSMVASPLAVSDATLAEHWRFIEARAGAAPGPELMPGGAMERIEDLSGSGWRHFAQPIPDVASGVEIARTAPASGQGNLRIFAEPRDPAAPPVVVETPPVWVTTPSLPVQTGRLLEITARVRVPQPIAGSVDGLLVFDSLGGPALAERVKRSGDWQRLVLHRIAPTDGDAEPLVITFALTGLGAAEIDDVSVRQLERGAALVAAPAPQAPAGGFPAPGDLLAPRALPEPKPEPAPAPAKPAAAWPGMSLAWPQLPFGQPSNAPPPGPGGGTIDPFKRARSQPPAQGGS